MKINAQLHSVITVVSARKWTEIRENPLFQKQVVFANKVIVSFVDVVGEEKYKEISSALKEINLESHIITYFLPDLVTKI